MCEFSVRSALSDSSCPSHPYRRFDAFEKKRQTDRIEEGEKRKRSARTCWRGGRRHSLNRRLLRGRDPNQPTPTGSAHNDSDDDAAAGCCA